MNPALWIGKTGVDAQNTRLAVISNNLANINTTGFKADRAIFQDLFYQNVRQPGAQANQVNTLPSGLQLGTGVQLVATQKLFTDGNYQNTGAPLDVAINGRGFFQVLLPDGTLAYTRDGIFQLDENGQLLTSGGYTLEPGIQIPDNSQGIFISRDGVVSVKLPNDPTPNQVGNIQLADFINPSGLQPIGENLFLETQSSGAPIIDDPANNGLGTLRQGMLETSNVNAVEELVNMIEAQRAYEMNTRAISTADQMLQFMTTNL
jgi:flagellar basal-body rod protein FlgG